MYDCDTCYATGKNFPTYHGFIVFTTYSSPMYSIHSKHCIHCILLSLVVHTMDCRRVNIDKMHTILIGFLRDSGLKILKGTSLDPKGFF